MPTSGYRYLYVGPLDFDFGEAGSFEFTLQIDLDAPFRERLALIRRAVRVLREAIRSLLEH